MKQICFFSSDLTICDHLENSLKIRENRSNKAVGGAWRDKEFIE